jgi:hypothetical protein
LRLRLTRRSTLTRPRSVGEAIDPAVIEVHRARA